ncbi:MAG: hypothetical protein GY854_10095 [Deltaproteobacteria bacterium]|nr:hypothetical protein [Deltaproteobacteria bacterium]
MVEYMQGWAFIGILRSVSRVWGEGTISQLTDQFSDELKQLQKHQLQSSSTYPISLTTEVLHHIEKAYGNGQGLGTKALGDEAGRLVVDSVLSVYRGVGDLSRALGAFPRTWQKIYPDSKLNAEIVSVSETEGVVRIQKFPENSDLWMPFWAGWFRGYLTVAIGSNTAVSVRAKEIDSAVEFHISVIA